MNCDRARREQARVAPRRSTWPAEIAPCPCSRARRTCASARLRRCRAGSVTSSAQRARRLLDAASKRTGRPPPACPTPRCSSRSATNGLTTVPAPVIGTTAPLSDALQRIRRAAPTSADSSSACSAATPVIVTATAPGARVIGTRERLRRADREQVAAELRPSASMPLRCTVLIVSTRPTAIRPSSERVGASISRLKSRSPPSSPPDSDLRDR